MPSGGDLYVWELRDEPLADVTIVAVREVVA